ncbi:cyclase family protein [Streptomyces sp. NPDC056669]|uniref:cyclase family protein n=1 Tax=unclassified Streptomyces TaxID=2593676 RepID=UPI00365192CF
MTSTSSASGFTAGIASGAVEVIDLTTPLHSGTPVVPVPPPFAPSAGFTTRPVSDFDERGPGWSWSDMTLGEHTGTHVDAPRHWISGREGRAVDQISPTRLIGPVAVIDKTAEVAENQTFLLGAEHFEEWEHEHGPLEPGSWVIFRSGWSAYGFDPERFLDPKGWPGLSIDGAKWLAAHPAVSGYGVEAVGIDSMGAGPSEPGESGAGAPDPGEFGPGHYYLLGADKYGLTSLRNVDRLPPRGATIVVAPLPIVGGTAGPARVFAFVDRS